MTQQYSDLPAGAQIVQAPEQPADRLEQVAPQGSFSDLPSGATVIGATDPEGNHLRNVGTNFLHGAEQTGLGLNDLVRHVPGVSTLEEKAGLDDEKLQRWHDTADTLVGSDADKIIGYGGESLLEFLMGDELLKGLSFAEKLSKSAKVAKILQDSPRLLKALKMGASVSKAMGELGPEERKLVQESPVLSRLVGAGMDAIRSSAVQGGQTFVKTGGNVKEALKEAAAMGLTSGVFGGVTGVASGMLTKAGATAEGVQKLSQVADDAATKEEVAQTLGKRIDKAKDALHEKYDTGINDLKDRLEGTDIDYENSPLHKAAKALADKGEAESKPLDAAFAQARPGSNRVNSMVDLLADPEKEAEAKAEAWVDADGVKHVEPLAKEEKPSTTLDIHELIERRQLLGQRMRKLGWATSEDRADREVYRTLIQGIDDTIGKLADKSGDEAAVADYEALRKSYREKINLYDEPVIDRIREGKMDDAAKAFVGAEKSGSGMPLAGKVRHNTEVLKQILGDEGLKEFGKDVFGTMLKDASDNGRFNPAKFMKTWNRIAEETKADLFDTNAAQSGLKALAADAKAGAAFQHLTRAGVLMGIGGVVGKYSAMGMGLGSLLGLTVAEGGGIQAGRDLLNYIANHPAMWEAYKGAAKIANSGVAQKAARTAQILGGKAAAQGVDTRLEDALNSTGASLSGQQ